MNPPLSVSALNEQIKNLLESTFIRVYVEGELSRITYHNSGHIYFTLKDSGSAISCVMFRGNASHLRFRLEEGLKVVLEAAVTVYKPRGQYQLNVLSVEPAGHGALALAYEQLKEKLSAQGYFDPSRKKAVPKVPKKIALVTSATGAALQDMQRVAAQRWPLAELYVYDAIVQGEQAASSIVRALKAADSAGYDVIVVGRGGGSIEDLWAFNEEIVADAIFHAKTAVVSAVGHEIDHVISDFVADLRAPTPSAAMQMILPDQNELLQYIDTQSDRYASLLHQRLQQFHERVGHLRESYRRHSIDQRLQNAAEEVSQLSQRLAQQVVFRLEGFARDLDPLKRAMQQQIESSLRSCQTQIVHLLQAHEANDPRKKGRRGYAQIVKEKKVVSLKELQINDTFEAMDQDVKVSATVTNIQRISSDEH